MDDLSPLFCFSFEIENKKACQSLCLSGFMSNPCRILHSGCIFIGWPGFCEIKKICQLSEEVQLRYQFVIISEMWSSVEFTFHWNHYSQHCVFKTACFAKECWKWSVWDQKANQNPLNVKPSIITQANQTLPSLFAVTLKILNSFL